MTSRDFCYWLQGFFELRPEGDGGVTAGQAKLIQQHLAMVFIHEIDPSAGGSAHQEKLNDAHPGMSKEDVAKSIEEAFSKLPKPSPFGGPKRRC